MTRRLLTAAQLVLAAALLLWPALIAGRPAVFSDTDGYYWLGESLAEAGLQSLLNLFGDDRPLVAESSLFAADGLQYLSFMGARSPSYALFLFLSERLGSLWFTVCLQALATAWTLRTLLRAAVPAAGAGAFLGLTAGLSATTSLPFYVTFAMPDLFAGLGAVALALLLAFPDRLPRPTFGAVWILLALSLSFHRSNLLVGVVLLVAVGAVLARRRGVRTALRRAAVPASAAAAAIAALLIYPGVIRALPGPAEMQNPPFLMARVLADGPGRSYLAEACRRGVDYALCAFQHVEMTDAEAVLWSQEPGRAVFGAAAPETRARLKAEEAGFVLNTLRHAPAETLAAALRNVGLQLIRSQVAEPLESPAQYLQGGQGAIPAILPGADACRAAPAACGSPLDAGLLRWLHALVVTAAVGFLAYCALGRRGRPAAGATDDARLAYAATVLTAFVLVNAALCGALSVPAPRYEARVIWLLPAAAGMLAVALARRRQAVWGGSPLDRRRAPGAAGATLRSATSAAFAALRRAAARARLAPLPAWSAIFLAAALLIWPAVVAGRPLVFYDTDGYRSAGASVLSLVWRLGARLFGAEGPLIHEMSLFAPWSSQALDFMGARSPYYGMFLVASSTVGTLWTTLYLQGLAAAWGVWTWMRAAAPAAGPRRYLATMGVLAAGSALPFYVSFLMPDLFTAVALVSAVLLLVYPDRLGRLARVAAWLLLAGALTFHTSNLLAVAAVLALAALTIAARGGVRVAARRCAPVAAALVAAVAGVAAYPLGVRALSGPMELNNPPFLTARVLADGPGRLHLKEACADARPYALCDYQDRNLGDSDVFLWESEQGGGVYSAATTPERMRLLDEQLRFVVESVKRAPLQQLSASLANWGEQLADFEVVEPIVSQGRILADPYGAAKVVPGAGACAADPASCDPPFAVTPLKLAHGLMLLLATGFAGWRLTRTDVRVAARAALDGEPDGGEARRTVAAAVLLLSFLLVNAAVGGVLSGPAPRYEARVVWLLPVLAAVAALALPRVPVEPPARLQRLDHPLLRFSAVGGAGFVVDATLTHLLVHGADLHAFTARLVSFSVAVTFTWLLNRYWTFVERRSRRRVKEAARYLLVQGLGATANLGVYALVLTLAPTLEAWLIVPLACGAAAGLCVTYVGSARFVFARQPAE